MHGEASDSHFEFTWETVPRSLYQVPHAPPSQERQQCLRVAQGQERELGTLQESLGQCRAELKAASLKNSDLKKDLDKITLQLKKRVRPCSYVTDCPACYTGLISVDEADSGSLYRRQRGSVVRDTIRLWMTGSTTCTWPRLTWRESEQENGFGMLGRAWGGVGVLAAAGGGGGAASCCWERGGAASCCWEGVGLPAAAGRGWGFQLLLGGAWRGVGLPAAAG